MTPTLFAAAGALAYGPGWQSRLAAQLGLSRARINDLASGRRSIPADLARQVARDALAALDAAQAELRPVLERFAAA